MYTYSDFVLFFTTVICFLLLCFSLISHFRSHCLPLFNFSVLFFHLFFSSLDSGNTAPDPNSRRSMARFQTYLDRTHAQLSATAQTATPSIIPIPRSSPIGLDRGMDRDRERGERDRGDRDRVGDRDRGDRDRERVERGFTRTLVEVLDTLTCPLEKIGTLLGHNGKYSVEIPQLLFLNICLSLSVSLSLFASLFSLDVPSYSVFYSASRTFSSLFLHFSHSCSISLLYFSTLSGVTLRRIIDISGADIIVNHDLPPSMPRILGT